jgi:hypothetical protein
VIPSKTTLAQRKAVIRARGSSPTNLNLFDQPLVMPPPVVITLKVWTTSSNSMGASSKSGFVRFSELMALIDTNMSDPSVVTTTTNRRTWPNKRLN